MSATRATFAAILVLASASVAESQSTVRVVAGQDLAAPARYGLDVLTRALESHGLDSLSANDSQEPDSYVFGGSGQAPGRAGELLEVLGVSRPEKAEGLVIRRTRFHGKPALILFGADARGLMYAALDTADRIGWAAGAADPFLHVQDADEAPYIGERAVSIYTMHRRHFESRLYDETYWRRYFDALARSRINSFVVIFGYENGGFLAPAYPYFFNTPEFPEIRLVGITPQQQSRNTAAFRRMVEIAHERGVDFSVAIWDHIYRGGVQGGGIQGASELAGKEVLGLVSGVTADNLSSYTKASLRRFLETFPELDGLQFRMHGESGLKREEMPAFWHEIFAMIRNFKPEMRVDIRAKELPDSIIEDALDQGLRFRVATKYWMEQMGLPFHPTRVNEQNQHDRRHGYADLLRLPQKYRVHWRLWNGGTTRLLLWGDPEYVRRFAQSARLYGGDSFEVNEMLATKMLAEPHDVEPRPILNDGFQYYDYEFERYWHHFQLWGRVAYDPDVDPAIWEREFERRFGAQAGPAVMEALHLGGRVLPRIVASSYRYRWFPTTRGWAEMNPMGRLPDYLDEEGSDIEQFQNVADAAKSMLEGTDVAMRRPEENSRWFAEIADAIERRLDLAGKAADAPANTELLSTTVDLRILAGLARFHSERTLGGLHYALYKESGDLASLREALRREDLAVAAWAGIVDAAGAVYRDDLAFGVEQLGFARHWKDVLADLQEGLAELRDEEAKALSAAESAGDLEIAHVPLRRIGIGERLAVRATIRSSAELKSAEVVLSGKDGSSRVRMVRIAPFVYEASAPGSAKESRVSYVIEVGDAEGRTAIFPANRQPILLEIASDVQPPDVSVERPHKAVPGRDLLVRALAHDDSGVKSLRLRYRHLTQFENYRTAEMRYDSDSGLYAAVIPGDFITPDWNLIYFVEAIDTKGNGRIYPDLEREAPYVVVETKP